MVIVLDAQEAVTPFGRPVAVPIPVAPVVTCVIAVRGLPKVVVGVEDAVPTVLSGVTVIVPVAEARPQPPVSGML
jgi:hypothetical protein